MADARGQQDLGRVTNSPRAAGGFSLFETVIVIAIIGVLAMIVVPRVSNAAGGAREAATLASVRVMRRAMDYYGAEHDGRSPAHNADWTVSKNEAVFAFRMTRRTDDCGSPGGNFGPYLRSLPVNPANGLSTLRIGGGLAGSGTHGWWYSPDRDVLLPDDSPESAVAVIRGVFGHLSDATKELVGNAVKDGSALQASAEEAEAAEK